MKKLMFAAALTATFGIFADVESSNIVGYASRTINNEFKLASVQFESCADGEVPINGTINCTSEVAVPAWVDAEWDDYTEVDGWRDSAPQIQVPKTSGSGYDIYYYVSNARSAEDESNVGAGWVDNSGYLAQGVVPVGFGIWTRGYANGADTVADTDFTFAGAVCGDDSVSVSCDSTFKLRANPFPVAAGLNSGISSWSGLPSVSAWVDAEWDDYSEVDGWRDAAPQIQVPKTSGSGYDIYYYVSNARSPEDESNVGAGWVDNSGYLAVGTLPVAYGMWLNARTVEEINLVFNK